MTVEIISTTIDGKPTDIRQKIYSRSTDIFKALTLRFQGDGSVHISAAVECSIDESENLTVVDEGMVSGPIYGVLDSSNDFSATCTDIQGRKVDVVGHETLPDSYQI